jgi:putative flippase GtrA
VTGRFQASLLRVPATFVRYVAVGLVSFVVDAGTLWLLYTVVGTELWLATSVGFWLSFAVNFGANKLFTFGRRANGVRQLIRFAVLVGANYVANLAIVTGLVALGLPALAGKTIAVGLLTVVNYFSYRVWVFRD